MRDLFVLLLIQTQRKPPMIYAYFLTICVKIHNNSMTIAFTGVVKLIFDMNVIEKNHVMMRFKK